MWNWNLHRREKVQWSIGLTDVTVISLVKASFCFTVGIICLPTGHRQQFYDKLQTKTLAFIVPRSHFSQPSVCCVGCHCWQSKLWMLRWLLQDRWLLWLAITGDYARHSPGCTSSPSVFSLQVLSRLLCLRAFRRHASVSFWGTVETEVEIDCQRIQWENCR